MIRYGFLDRRSLECNLITATLVRFPLKSHPFGWSHFYHTHTHTPWIEMALFWWIIFKLWRLHNLCSWILEMMYYLLSFLYSIEYHYLLFIDFIACLYIYFISYEHILILIHFFYRTAIIIKNIFATPFQHSNPTYTTSTPIMQEHERESPGGL